MQERNYMDETVSSEMINEKLKMDLAELQGEVTHKVVGKIPERKDRFRLNGLDYEVISNDFIKGTFKARLVNLKGLTNKKADK